MGTAPGFYLLEPGPVELHLLDAGVVEEPGGRPGVDAVAVVAGLVDEVLVVDRGVLDVRVGLETLLLHGVEQLDGVLVGAV